MVPAYLGRNAPSRRSGSLSSPVSFTADTPARPGGGAQRTLAVLRVSVDRGREQGGVRVAEHRGTALLLSSLRDHGSERGLYSDAEEEASETEQESD